MSVSIYTIGDRGITLSIDGEISLENQQKIWWIGKKIEEGEDASIIDIVPGMNNLTILLNPYSNFDRNRLKQKLRQLWEDSKKNNFSQEMGGKLLDVPVVYGGKKGPDLLEVAKQNHMTIDEVIKLHTAPIYTVYFIGFMPGFVYLGGLDSKIHTPRRSKPRMSIPAGSVGIGGAQTGVYPRESPGGWQIIGNTELLFFDRNRDKPSLFLPGDQLRFVVEEILV